MISRDSWAKCFYFEYVLAGSRGSGKVKEAVFEKYGIEHWEKINMDEYKLIFTDEKKMTYWMLKWA
jgi:hypothetical protein